MCASAQALFEAARYHVPRCSGRGPCNPTVLIPPSVSYDADLVGSDDEMGDGSMRVSLQQLALIGSFYVNVRISLGGTIRLQARARGTTPCSQVLRK